MNEKINRNDPCPCGSGKKYKKCCGAGEAISITHMIESEIDDLQKQMLQFAFYHYGVEIQSDFEDFAEVVEIDEEKEGEFYEFIHAIWFSLFETLDDGETIVEKFIATEGRKLKRPKLKQILQSWTDVRTIAGKVIDLEGNKLTIEDGFTSEQLEAVLINQESNFEKGSFFVGMMMPFDQNYVFFPSPFDLPDLQPEEAFEFIEDSSLEAGYDSPQEYLTDFFMEVLNELPMMGVRVNIDELEWPAPVYKEVAEIFQRRLGTLNEPTSVVEIGVVLWYQFCQIKKKRIQNPYLYVAALHYLVATIVPMDKEFTQKDLANLYGVSTGGFSSIYREMAEALEGELTELQGIIEEDDDALFDDVDVDDFFLEEDMPQSSVVQFNRKERLMETERVMHEALGELEGKNFEGIDDFNQFINKKLQSPKKVPKGKKEQAQQLIFDAFETDGKQRYKLAEDALNLDPNCVDAYGLLAERASTLEEQARLYEKGMQAGEKELGKAFIKKNKGYFWGIIETRPFMRAKSQYGESLYYLGKINEAIQQYEEILELNPNDNQGIRYLLYVAHMDIGNFQKAGELLQVYDEATAQGLYNKLLLELNEKGFTAKALMLLKEAKDQNKHVIAYLTGKKRLPKYAPDYYGFGDENEAIIYAEAHLHLWKKLDGLVEWLKKH